MFGIIVMSPYVIRSVNAHLKTWEDSVDDSVNDPLFEYDRDVPTGACLCSPVLAGCHVGSCGKRQMLVKDLCTPIDCGASNERCVFNDTCCDDWVNIGQCGGKLPNGTVCTGNQIPKRGTCGEAITSYQCQDDVSCTSYSCVGIDPQNADLCPNDDKGLSGHTPKTLNANCGVAKCEYICQSGFELKNGTCQIAGQSPICPAGKKACYSCSAQRMVAQESRCCSGLNETGVCGCSPAPPNCYSCTGFTNSNYDDISTACGIAKDEATKSCPWMGLAQCGWFSGWSGSYSKPDDSSCGCSFSCLDSCENGTPPPPPVCAPQGQSCSTEACCSGLICNAQSKICEQPINCGNEGNSCATVACCQGQNLTCNSATLICEPPPVICMDLGESCATNRCCGSLVCNTSQVCEPPPACLPEGSLCLAGSNCCSLSCSSGRCSRGLPCTTAGGSCATSGSCCTGLGCSSGQCVSQSCQGATDSCTDGACCSGMSCTTGKCCVNTGNSCKGYNECCGGRACVNGACS